MPLYLGCDHIDQYFDNVMKLTGHVMKDIGRLTLILKNPGMYYRRTFTDKNKKTVNLIENLGTLF